MAAEELKEGLDAVRNEMEGDVNTYSVRNALDIYTDNRAEPPEIWGGLTREPGELMEIIGPSGLGKSRLVLNLAINQIFGRPFAGLPTYSQPLTWFFYGNENSFFRFRTDLRMMLPPPLDEHAAQLLGKHLLLPVMKYAEDADIALDEDGSGLARLKAALKKHKPDVVVFDPWGAVLAGDELKDADVRQCVMNIRRMLISCSEPDRPMTGIILNHSRMGGKEMVEAFGINSSNFGKNSKAIFTIVRNVWNLRPGNPEGTIVEMCNAKRSNGKRHGLKAIELVTGSKKDSFQYVNLPNFDHEAWQMILVELSHKKGGLTNAEEANHRQALENEVVEYVMAQISPISRKDLLSWLTKEKGLTDRRAGEMVASIGKSGRVGSMTERIPGGGKLFGSPEMIEKMKELYPESYK